MELQELLSEKQELDQATRAELRNLQGKLASEKDRIPQGNHKLVGEYNDRLSDLNIAYDDIITSTKEHVQMNGSIMRKEKEMKELEARIAFLSSGSSEEEHSRLLNIFENEKRALHELYRAQREGDERLMNLRHQKNKLENSLKAVKNRMLSIDDDIDDVKSRYETLKPPPKVGYVIDHSDDGRHLKPVNGSMNAQRDIVGLDYYHPDEYEIETMIPQGLKGQLSSDPATGGYRFGN